MKTIGKKYNKKVVTLISDMNSPLSNSIGNALEVEEAIRVLKGEECKLADISKEIASILISLAKKISTTEADELVREVIENKKALNKFYEFVKNQNGLINKLKIKANMKVIRSKDSGILKKIDAEKIGKLALKLGAGKTNDKEIIDYSAGIKLYKNINDKVKENDILAVVYTNKDIILSKEDINCFEIE